jgi:antitoxin (DNA-binding transcriptional repressor) of toxin-antitoxin stability system
MRSVALKVLKDKLGEYVRLATQGETVLVTDHDRVVAELVPPQPDRSPDTETFRERGVREGWLTPATVPKDTPLPPRHPVITFDEMMRDLDESREDR